MLGRQCLVAALRDAGLFTSVAPASWGMLGAEEFRFVAAAMFMAAITTPLDVARTRALVARSRAPEGSSAADAADGGDGADVARATLGSCLLDAYEEGGVPTLFAGLLPRILYSGVVVAGLIPLRALGFVAIRDSVILVINNGRP